MTESHRLPCKLCGTVAALRLSHIIPRWVYRRVAGLYLTPRERQPVLIHGGTAIYSGNQSKEYLLCAACERWFQRWEDYVAAISLQADDRFPAMDAVVPLAPRSADASALDCSLITRFAVSVIWRASASREFREVTLSPYADEFAAYLRDDNASFPGSARLLVELFQMRGRPPAERSLADHAIAGPATWPDQGHNDYRFAWFGMWFSLSVGGELPTNLDSMCLMRSKRVALGDGVRHLEAARELLGKTRLRGKLAAQSEGARRLR